LAMSFRFSPAAVQRELIAHTNILGCEVADVRCYLLAALAGLWTNRNQFPADEFGRLASKCLACVEQHLPQ